LKLILIIQIMALCSERSLLLFALLLSLASIASSAKPIYKAILASPRISIPFASGSTSSGSVSISIVNSNYATGYFFATNIKKMTQAHLHAGAVGVNGPAIAWAFNATYGPISGTIKASFTFNPSLNNISSLLNAGLVYFSVKTVARPAGELRGRLVTPYSTMAYATQSTPLDYSSLCQNASGLATLATSLFDLDSSNATITGNAAMAYLYGTALVGIANVTSSILLESPVPLLLVNRMLQETTTITPNDTTVPTPNVDTLYSFSVIDLTPGPIIISIPAVESRYYSIFLNDEYTDTVGLFGSSSTGSAAISVLLLGPSSADMAIPDAFLSPAPNGSPRYFRSTTSGVWLLGRTGIDGSASDTQAAISLMSNYNLTAYPGNRILTSSLVANAAIAAAQLAAEPAPPYVSSSYFQAINAQLCVSPPPSSESDLFSTTFNSVGIVANSSTSGTQACIDAASSSGSLPSSLYTAYAQGKSLGLTCVAALASSTGATGPTGWISSTSTGFNGTWGTNFLNRAVTAVYYLGQLPASEATYLTLSVSSTGNALTGANASSYTLAIPFNSMPVSSGGFWSVTMYYESTKLLVANPINRYSINANTPGIVLGSDGTLLITIQSSQPSSSTAAANWLPAPPAAFYLVMRLYAPTAASSQFIPPAAIKSA
jgi:hypothetical protein